jgi:hypothetical protein
VVPAARPPFHARRHEHQLGEDPQRAGLAWRSQLGIVLQSSTDAAELTVAEMVRHFARYYRRPHDPASVIELVGALFIGEATVNTHLLRIFGKLGVSDRTAAVTTAIARGILPSGRGG